MQESVQLPKTCNLCGGTEWGNMNTRIGVRCVACASLERTRAVKLVLDHCNAVTKGARILHFAPERGLANWLETISPDGYDPVDFQPKLYPYTRTRRFDMLTDVEALPSNYYDLILHLHVLEHIPCFLAPVLYHLYRSIKPTGLHIFCIPILGGFYDEYLGPLEKSEAVRRFGQFDHVRRFGEKDMDRHIGSLIKLKETYSLYDYADEATVDRHNIPIGDRMGLNSSTVFVTRKSDYRLG